MYLIEQIIKNENSSTITGFCMYVMEWCSDSCVLGCCMGCAMIQTMSFSSSELRTFQWGAKIQRKQAVVHLQMMGTWGSWVLLDDRCRLRFGTITLLPYYDIAYIMVCTCAHTQINIPTSLYYVCTHMYLCACIHVFVW